MLYLWRADVLHGSSLWWCSGGLFFFGVYRDQDWDLKDIQHHLVRTQRMQTAKNNKFVGDIARIDMDIEDLMKQVLSSPARCLGSERAIACASCACISF